jgi:hypothetical protein
MGFMDKVKAAAQDVATQAKSATAQAQDKMEQAQTRKKMDEAAKKLGYLVHRERTQGAPAGAEGDALVAEITGLEAQLQAAAAAPPSSETPVSHTDASTETPAPPTSASEPTSGDFKL